MAEHITLDWSDRLRQADNSATGSHTGSTSHWVEAG